MKGSMSNDPRLERYHPDLLPTHRKCPQCSPGSDVHPLDSAHFYERRDRYPWAASRFSALCRAHENERRRSSYATNAAAQNARSAERRRVLKVNRKLAAIFFTPAQVAIREQREQALREKKERIARVKRVSLRTYGPRDGIKKLIQSRQEVYRSKRLKPLRRTAADGRDNYSPPCPPEQSARMNAIQAHENLMRLRAQHAEDQSQRESSEEH